MERLSSIAILDGGSELMRAVSRRLSLRLEQFSVWLQDKSHQLRSLPGNKELIRAVLSAENSPAEGTRYRIGECINVYQPNGERIKLKICGIQSGGFSNVYTVVDLDEMRPYCLKENRAIPGDEDKKNEKLTVEAEIALRLSPCSNLVTTYAAIFYRSRLFILTEYLSSTSLDINLKNGPLPLETALKYGVQLSRAVRQARKILPGFIHGDIKPGNCFITADGKLKLGDFGLASADGLGKRSEDECLHKECLTEKSNSSIGWGGTAAYMAPEMFDRINPDRTNADVYAFGVTQFEMLCGTRPFTAPSKEEIVEMHRHEKPPMHLLAETGVPGSIIDLVERCLAKSPADRPPSFECVENELLRDLLDRFNSSVPVEPVEELTNSESLRRAFSFAGFAKIQEATACLDSAIFHWGMSSEILASKAIVQALGSRLDDAYETSTAALMTHVNSFVVFVAHSRVLMARGHLDIAEEYLLRALQLQPNNCVALNLIGSLYLQVGQYDEASSYFKISRMLDASQTEPWEGIAISNLFKGRPKKSICLLRKALAMDPRRTSLHRHLGDAFYANGQLVEAITSYKAALGFLPSSKETDKKFIRSCIELYKKNGGVAGVGFVRLLIRGTRVFKDRNKRGYSSNDLANYFISVLRGSNFDPLLLFFLDGALAKVAERLNTAVSQELVEMLRAIHDRSLAEAAPIYVLNSLGRIFYHLGGYKDCEVVFKTMLERFGPNEHAYYHLAACNEIKEDLLASLTYYKKALRLEDSEDSRAGFHRVRAKIRRLERLP